MDRRRALRSIALGGGAAVAGSAIVSSPAFAYDAPTPTGSGSIAYGSAGGNSNNRFDVDQTGLGSATCPMSANSTSAAVALVRWDVVTSAMTPANSVINIRINGGGGIEDNTSLGNPGTSTQTAGFRLRKRGAGGSGNRNWQSGDRFTITQVVRFTCTYSDSTTRTVDQSTTFTLTKGPGGAGAADWTIT